MKKMLSSIVLSILFSSSCFAQRANRVGVLPYAYDSQGKVHFLIGAEPKKGKLFVWSEFSGAQDEKDIDFPRQTAARVLNNGTRCYFGFEATQTASLDKKPKKPTISLCNKGIEYIMPRLKGNQLIPLTSYYSVYLAPIDWVDHEKFDRSPKIYEDGKLLVGATKQKFMWVSAQDLLAEIKSTPNRKDAKLPLKYRNAYGITLSPMTHDLLKNPQAQEIISALIKKAPQVTKP